MVQINRKAWLLFDIVGLVFVVFGALYYIGLFFNADTFVGLSLFLMGMFFVILGSIFGHLEGINVKEEITELIHEKNVQEAIQRCDDGGDGYILDIDAAEKKPVPDQVDMDELFEDPKSSKE